MYTHITVSKEERATILAREYPPGGRGRDEICFANYSWLKALFSQQHYSALINVLTLYIKQLHYTLNVTLMK